MSEVKVRLARPEDDERLGEILVSGYVTAYARKMPQVVLSDRRKAELREVGKKREQATVRHGGTLYKRAAFPAPDRR